MRLLAMLVAAVLVTAKLTAEQKRILKESADEADKHIRQITRTELPEFIKTGYHLIFFGAVWCKLTQRFTPKWLHIQDEFDRRGWKDVPGFGIAKVQCAYEAEEWCFTEMEVTQGYPTINLYKDGQLLEEYEHANDETHILRYLEHVFDLVKDMHTSNGVPGVAEASEVPVEEALKRKPVHHQIEKVAHLDEDMLDTDAVDEETYNKELELQKNQYIDELTVAQFSAMLALVVACGILAIFLWNGGSFQRSRRYQQVLDKS